MTGASSVLEILLWLLFSVGLLWSHGAAMAGQSWAARLRLLLLDVFVALFTWVALTDDERFARWMAEDAWVEWLTFFAFLAAGVLGLRQALRVHRRREVRERWPCVLVMALMVGTAAFCLFVAGEEISWGQRLFAFEPPKIFLEENFQQELNVHNLLKGKSLGSFELESRYLVILVAIVYGVLLPSALWLLRGLRLIEPVWRVGPRLSLAPFFAAVALGELTYEVDLTGEACEALLGLCFLTSAMRVGAARQGEATGLKAAGPTLGLGLGVLAAGLVTPWLLEQTVFDTDTERSSLATIELERLKQDLAKSGVVNRRFYKKSRVHKRVFTAVRAEYFSFEASSTYLEGRWTPAEQSAEQPRMDRVGYFLDPWNNPYWVIWDRDEKQLSVYSFGPNRRRDTDFDTGFKLSGDDIGFVWSAP